MIEADSFNPNWFSIPADTIREALEDRGISTTDLAESMDMPFEDFSEVMLGRRAIDEPLANKLEKSIGGSAHFWMNREAIYQRDLDRCAAAVDAADAKAWLASIPAIEMRKMGWIRPAANESILSSCLAFFDVANLEQWRSRYEKELAAVAFRMSSSRSSNTGSVVSWLRYGELLSRDMQCAPWDPAKLRKTLVHIKRLTRRKDPADFLPKLRELCAACGVAVVIAKPPAGCSASGATKFIQSDRAMILLSMRYLTDDQFWFTFFHEAGHLLLHPKKALFVETTEEELFEADEEAEANDFAFDMLVPKALQPELESISLNLKSVIDFANRCGVAPGIIVGQLQHAKRLKPSAMNSVKRRYSWAQIT